MFRFLIVVLALAVAAPVQAATVCRGQSLMDELAKRDPAAHETLSRKAAETTNGQALFWKVEKPGARTSWLLGTIHLTDDRLATVVPNAMTAFEASDKVVLEIAELSRAALASALQKVGPMLVNPAGNGLDKALSEQEQARVRAVLEETGLPLQLIGYIRPWYAYTLLSLPACERARASAGLPTVNSRLAQLATEKNKPVIGLETVEQQLAALGSLPEDQQIQLLHLALKLSDRIDDLTETLVQLYVGRKIGAVMPLNLLLAREAGVPESAFQQFEVSILVKRNYKMLERLTPLLSEGGAFVGVGALHLVGEEGLVTLLRKAGFTVTAAD